MQPLFAVNSSARARIDQGPPYRPIEVFAPGDTLHGFATDKQIDRCFRRWSFNGSVGKEETVEIDMTPLACLLINHLKFSIPTCKLPNVP